MTAARGPTSPPAPAAGPEAIAAATAFLGDDAPPAGSPAGRYVAALAAWLEAHEGAAARGEQDDHLEQLTRVGERTALRLSTLADVERATARLAELSAPGDVLAASPALLGEISDVRRVVLGAVGEGELTVQRVHVRGTGDAGDALLEALRGEPIRLGHPLVESDLLRRRRAVTVDAAQDPARVHPRLATVMDWREFVAAPVAIGSAVIAILYVDSGPQTAVGRDLREVTARFAAEVARTYETARLRRAIRSERQEMERFAAWLENRSRALSGSPHELEPAQPADAPAEQRGPSGPAAQDVFAGVLTRRELEVLRLLGEGRSNRAIADQLVLSPATVKSHVYRIMTKLRVANRAEAVALYLTPRDPR